MLQAPTEEEIKTNNIIRKVITRNSQTTLIVVVFLTAIPKFLISLFNNIESWSVSPKCYVKPYLIGNLVTIIIFGLVLLFFIYKVFRYHMTMFEREPVCSAKNEDCDCLCWSIIVDKETKEYEDFLAKISVSLLSLILGILGGILSIWDLSVSITFLVRKNGQCLSNLGRSLLTIDTLLGVFILVLLLWITFDICRQIATVDANGSSPFLCCGHENKLSCWKYCWSDVGLLLMICVCWFSCGCCTDVYICKNCCTRDEVKWEIIGEMAKRL